jgi:cell division protein FtsI (penicillin-binding protein 3)
MGYQVGVTPLQMATAASTVANGGPPAQPRVVRAFIKDGRARGAAQGSAAGDHADTAATLTTIMEQVVERGTAPRRTDRGYTIAGKTGTRRSS